MGEIGIGAVAQFVVPLLGQRVRLCNAPLRQQAGVHQHILRCCSASRAGRAQPVEQGAALGVVENIVERVAALEPAVAVRHGEQDGGRGCPTRCAHAVFMPAGKLQALQGLVASVDNVAGEPKGVGAVVETDFVQQGIELVVAALQIAECVVCHRIQIRCSDGLWLRPSQKG